MKYKLRDVVDQLDYDELVKIKKDLESGGVHLKNFIGAKVKEKEIIHRKNCTVCQSEISQFSTSNYTLVFGPADFRKKATFCAVDCLKYFITNLEKFNEHYALKAKNIQNNTTQTDRGNMNI